MIIKPVNEVLLLGWESVAENQEKGFLRSEEHTSELQSR